MGVVDLAMTADDLLKQLQNGVGADRWAAAVALGQWGHAPAVEPLCRALLERDGLLQEAAADALVRIGAPAAEPLCRLLGAQERDVLTTVVRLGPVVVPHLLKALRDRNAKRARAAAWALGELALSRPTPELRQALPTLRRGPRVLRGESAVHWASVYALIIERIEKATVDLEPYPLPAGPPTTAREELPVPAAPSAGFHSNLPRPTEPDSE